MFSTAFPLRSVKSYISILMLTHEANISAYVVSVSHVKFTSCSTHCKHWVALDLHKRTSFCRSFRFSTCKRLLGYMNTFNFLIHGTNLRRAHSCLHSVSTVAWINWMHVLILDHFPNVFFFKYKLVLLLNAHTRCTIIQKHDIYVVQ